MDDDPKKKIFSPSIVVSVFRNERVNNIYYFFCVSFFVPIARSLECNEAVIGGGLIPVNFDSD